MNTCDISTLIESGNTNTESNQTSIDSADKNQRFRKQNKVDESILYQDSLLNEKDQEIYNSL